MAAAIGQQLGRSLAAGLAGHYAVAAAMARLVQERPESEFGNLASALGAPLGVTARVAADFVRRGWLVPAGTGWRAAATGAVPAGVPAFLEGAAACEAARPEESRCVAAVTMPPEPSAIASALKTTTPASAGLVSTREAFQRLADAASECLTVMTPFLNADGLAWALEVFRRTRAPRKRLILRSAHGGPGAALRAHQAQIEELAILVSTYTLPVPDGHGYETFHAKIVLADNTLAYVGSANLLAHARHSMELGVLVDGRAAFVISGVVRAAESVAVPVGR